VEVVVVLPAGVEDVVVEVATVDEVVDPATVELVVEEVVLLVVELLTTDVVVVAPAQGFGWHVPAPRSIPPRFAQSVAERSWHCIPGRLGEGLGSDGLGLGLGFDGLGSCSALGDGAGSSPPSRSSSGLAAPLAKQHWMGASVVVVVEDPTVVVVVLTAPHGSGTQLPSPPTSTPPCAVQSVGVCDSQTKSPLADEDGRQQLMSWPA